jgi:L-aspartate oxidase
MCTGLHGANRLASNSLLEALVVAHRAAAAVVADTSQSPQIQIPEWQSGRANDPDELVVVYHNWREIRQLMWDYVGIVRSTKRLRRASTRLQNLDDEVKDYYWNHKVTADVVELRNLVLVARLIVDSALLRQESRGLHYTLNFPQTHPLAQDTVLDPLT